MNYTVQNASEPAFQLSSSVTLYTP